MSRVLPQLSRSCRLAAARYAGARWRSDHVGSAQRVASANTRPDTRGVADFGVSGARWHSGLAAHVSSRDVIHGPGAQLRHSSSPFGRVSQRRTMFIQTQSTPNADAIKFLPGREIMPGGKGSVDFPSVRVAGSSPLARKLFAVDGVQAVFFGADFVTITKSEDVSWDVVRPEIFEVVMDFFISEEQPPVILEDGAEPWNSDTAISDDDSEVVAMIKELLETRVKPAVAEDGGSILFRGFDEKDGVVSLELQGACSTCSSSSITLKNGVENMLRHYIPEVKEVRQVLGEHASDLQKANHEAFNKVEKELTDKGIIRS